MKLQFTEPVDMSDRRKRLNRNQSHAGFFQAFADCRLARQLSDIDGSPGKLVASSQVLPLNPATHKELIFATGTRPHHDRNRDLPCDLTGGLRRIVQRSCNLEVTPELP